jgi:RIP metalloprotease RseP
VSDTTTTQSGLPGEPEPRSSRSDPAGVDTDAGRSDAAAWMAGGAGTGDTGRNNGVRVAVALLVVAVAVRFLGPFGLAIIAAIVVSIVLHEAGHFWAAKACGMKVTEFFIGFGPRLLSFRRGETEYGLKPIPAGAYVKIVGMSSFEEVDPADEARTYRQQGTFKRIIVVAAGPAMNLLIAFVLFSALFATQGKQLDSWSIRAVEADSSAADAGLREGDRIVSIDGQSVGSFEAFSPMISAKAGTEVQMLVQRDGQEITVPVDLGWRLSAETAAAFPSSPKLQRSDVIASYTVAGGAEPVTLATYDQLRTVLAEPGSDITLRVVRKQVVDDKAIQRPYDLVVQRPNTSLPVDGSAGFLGVRPDTQVEELGLLGGMRESVATMGSGVTQTASALGRLVTPAGISDLFGQVGDAVASKGTPAISGETGALTPVGDSPPAAELAAMSESRPTSIVGAAYLGADAAELGWAAFIGVVAALNMALGLINLFPMLPLDGGHIAVASYEGIRGRIRGQRYTADLTKLMPVVYAFVALLLVVAVPTILLDVLSPPSLR